MLKISPSHESFRSHWEGGRMKPEKPNFQHEQITHFEPICHVRKPEENS